MKLFHLVLWRTSLALMVILAMWAGLFYMAVMEEVNDEVDDSLEDYAESLIIRSLSGEELPSSGNGTNNQYYLYEVSKAYAEAYPHITYRDEDVYITEKGENEPARVLMIIFQTDDGSYRELVVYTPTIEKQDLQRAILGWIIFLYVFLLLVIIGINVWVYKRNMRPLYVLLNWLDSYRLGHKNAPLENKTKITEFKRLNEAAIAAAGRNEALYEQQKVFIGNASHEMQTPLAICRNRLELLMEEDGLTEHQLEELMKTHQTLENLSRMNRSLLMLCKIENGQFSDVNHIPLNDLLERYVPDFREVYAYRNINLEIENSGVFHVDMDASLASMLVTNLLKNAFVHNVDGGMIRIVVSADSFSIANTGGPELDGQRVFERFYQSQKKEGSTGLGMALVDTICRTNRLRISYRYVGGMHCFEISHQ